jgi:hypothetical protein
VANSICGAAGVGTDSANVRLIVDGVDDDDDAVVAELPDDPPPLPAELLELLLPQAAAASTTASIPTAHASRVVLLTCPPFCVPVNGDVKNFPFSSWWLDG